MLPYASLASLLEEIGKAGRAEKVQLVSSFLLGLEPDSICLAVRLLMGTLWPSWEGRELGLGPEALVRALQEISRQDVSALRQSLPEMGAVAMKALLDKRQQTLSLQPLDALFVYSQLRRAATFAGQDSERRRGAILQGLLLTASPLEGKYLARMVDGNMRSGLGPQAMLASIIQAFGGEQEELIRAYHVCPDLGLVAMSAAKGELRSIRIRPTIPLKLMQFDLGEPIFPSAGLPLYPGLRVQVHKAGSDFGIYTSRLRNITASLNSLSSSLMSLEHDFIVDARLTGFLQDRMLGQGEVVQYINRRHLSRRSRVSAALVAYDLLYLDGQDLTDRPYQQRRERMLSVMGAIAEQPFPGLAAAPEKMLWDYGEAESFRREIEKQSAEGLLARSPAGIYLPGKKSTSDFRFLAQETIRMAVVRARLGRGRRKGLLARYGLALRSGDDLVQVGWASAGLSMMEAQDLSDHLHELVLKQADEEFSIRPQIVLTLKVPRAVSEGQTKLDSARIVKVQYDGALGQVDELARLDQLF